MENIGKNLVFLGVVILLLGLVIWMGPKIPGLAKLGRLPGDIRIEKENFSFYFPLSSSLLLSLLLSAFFLLFKNKH